MFPLSVDPHVAEPQRGQPDRANHRAIQSKSRSSLAQLFSLFYSNFCVVFWPAPRIVKKSTWLRAAPRAALSHGIANSRILIGAWQWLN
jgi:hypothetical protein